MVVLWQSNHRLSNLVNDGHSGTRALAVRCRLGAYADAAYEE